ncbi:MAG TPA: glycosyl hydrolase family 8 [Microvirga sp.]|jgi:endoglucanase
MTPIVRTLAALVFVAAGLAPAAAEDRSRQALTPPPDLQAEQARLDSSVPSWLEQAWTSYKARFVVDGRVIDNVNRITHSEGQGYAMLIAVRAQDQTGFDQIWRWTRRELFVRGDDLASWKWEENATPRVTDQNNATDGDILIAWALVEAGERWKSAEYVDAARRIVSAIGRKTLVRSPFGLLMLPGVDGFKEGQQPDGPVVNLSYWVFPAFDRLKGLSPEIDWSDVQATGLRLIRNSRFGPMRLPADWTAIGAGNPQPARNFPPRFGYNAVRIPLYLAWAKLNAPANLRPFAGLWNETLDVGPFEIDLTSGSALTTFGGTGFKAVASVVSCALDRRKIHPSVRSIAMEDYYPTTLHILSLIVLQERYPECL